MRAGRIAITASTALATLGIAACGGGETTTTATTSSTATTSTEPGSFTGTSTTSSTTSTSTSASAEGAPIEELVANAAGVEPEEVDCGSEGIEEVLGNGGTCSADDREYVVADYGEDLELDTLTARIDDLQQTKTVRGNYLKPHDSKSGTFAVATLSITNEGNGTQVFDDFGEQATLKAGADSYREPFSILNGVATDSFLWQAKKIKPGSSTAGDVVFDIPEAAAAELDTNGAIQILNFGAEGNIQRSDQIGLLRTG